MKHKQQRQQQQDDEQEEEKKGEKEEEEEEEAKAERDEANTLANLISPSPSPTPTTIASKTAAATRAEPPATITSGGPPPPPPLHSTTHPPPPSSPLLLLLLPCISSFLLSTSTTAAERAEPATITSGGPKEGRWSVRTRPQSVVADFCVGLTKSTTKAVESTTLAFQRIDHIHSSHGLAFRVFRVRDRIANHVLQKHLQHTTGLLVDETRDAFHAATTSQATDGWFRDALNIVTEDLPVAFSASLFETLSTFTAT
ncbi:unnamed protein product [Mesocestoides corti]|uniref:Uncharacterized protein n=1 Tax=Mesocestoides corti TaxID=53468 RepID=A0A0R3UJ58_MESCO|nr:unnamed protein product [Mesocestoides corti]